MAIWFFAALFGVIFSTFFFLYGPERASTEDPSYAAAEIFIMCHNAALTEARSNTLLGSGAPAARRCAGSGVNALTTPIAAGMNVDGLAITIEPGATVGLATGRVVVTYLPVNTDMNAIGFAIVRAQFGQRFMGNATAGEVQDVGGIRAINTVPTVVARVPATIAIGSLAMVTSVQP